MPLTAYQEAEAVKMFNFSEPPEGYTTKEWMGMCRCAAVLGDEYPTHEVAVWPADHTPFVYFIFSRTRSHVKIGISRRIFFRVGQLKTTVPEGLSEVWYCPGGRADEKGLHKQFAAHRQSGEWFTAHPDILAEIQRRGCDYVPANHPDESYRVEGEESGCSVYVE